MKGSCIKKNGTPRAKRKMCAICSAWHRPCKQKLINVKNMFLLDK